MVAYLLLQRHLVRRGGLLLEIVTWGGGFFCFFGGRGGQLEWRWGCGMRWRGIFCVGGCASSDVGIFFSIGGVAGAVWRWGCGGCATKRASDRPVAKLCLCERQPSIPKQKTAIQESFNSNNSSNPFLLAGGIRLCTKCSSHFNWFMHRLKCMGVDPILRSPLLSIQSTVRLH